MVEFINKYVIGATLPTSLMLTGIYFLIRLKFFPVTKAKAVVRHMAKNEKGAFKALALSLAGTLGVGNIVGVTSAIYAGGFGAIFWMWVSALVASILKYCEIVLAMRHRVPSSTGFKGGAPYYIKDCLAPRLPLASGLLSRLFALLCIANCLSMGAVMQTNAISSALEDALNIPPLTCGIALAFAAFCLLKGGAVLISHLTSALVPFMSLFYVVVSLAVILPRAELLPQMLSKILSSAFCFESALGGFFGFLTSRALRFGVMRGLFSNEAGCGTSPTAHISSNSPPCQQGFMGILEVLIDTVLLCSMTAFTVMLGYEKIEGLGNAPMKMALAAYSSAFPPAVGKIVECAMALMVLCFGFAAISCLSHYALECLAFLTKNKRAARIFIPLYSGAVLAGALTSAAAAWAVSDLTVGVMTLINLGVLLYKRDEIAHETDDFFQKNKNISNFDKKFTKPS